MSSNQHGFPRTKANVLWAKEASWVEVEPWVFAVPSATVLARFCNIQEARSERDCCSAEAKLLE